jgi:hypothetical protein
MGKNIIVSMHLFTCRKLVYKEASKLGAFVTENIVDLQSKANQLTETEKMAICQHHCKSKGLNPVNKIFEWFIEEAFSQPLVFFIQCKYFTKKWKHMIGLCK